MGDSWNREYQGIGIRLGERVVHIQNDDALDLFLSSGKKPRAFQLAEYLKEKYRKEYGKELKITDRSLACEIYWHWKIKIRSLKAEQKHGKRKLTSWLLWHMEDIDCGDRKADNNRFLWNLLSLVFFAGKQPAGQE